MLALSKAGTGFLMRMVTALVRFNEETEVATGHLDQGVEWFKGYQRPWRLTPPAGMTAFSTYFTATDTFRALARPICSFRSSTPQAHDANGVGTMPRPRSCTRTK
jgi:hypothetical protein